MPDREYTSVTCNTLFTHTEKDQAHYELRGYADDPKRCKPCRRIRRDEALRAESKARKQQQAQEAHVCCVCGADFLLSFPKEFGRPAYCPSHFEQ